MHQNSLEAHTIERDSGRLSKRAQAIQECLQGYDRHGLTDRQIMEALNLPERNCVAPRVTEMVKAGILEEVGSTIDRLTGKRVRLVRLRMGQQRLF